MLPSALREFAVLHANACSTTLVQLSRLSPCMSRCISTGTPSCRASITGHTQDGLGPPNLASYGFPIDSGKHSAFRRAGSLTPRTGKHNTEVGAELDKRVKALEVAAEAETTALDPPVYSEDDLLALYEDLLALPKVHPKEESRASSEKSRQESDIEHVTALEQRLLQAVQSHPSTSGASNADSNPQLHSRAIAYCRKLIDSSTNIATEANESVPSISDMESLQRLCIEAGDIQSAQVVLNTMKHFELAISEDVINPILRHLASEGKVTELEAVMHEHLTIPTDRQRHFHVKVHLNACSPDVIPTSAIDLLHVYEAQNLPAPMQTYTSVITSLFTTNLHLGRAQAWDLFSHMRYVAHPNPDGVLYTLMIRGCASPVGVRSSEPERALDLWTEMTVDHKIPPTAGSYDAVILACARSGKPAYVGEAFRLAKQMLDSHRDAQGMSAFAPTRRTFCALLEGAKRVGDLGKARWILAEMASDRRRADGTADPEGIHEEIMMHMFHSYASYNAPLRRSAFRLSKPPAPTSNTTIAPLEAESNGLSSQEEITTTQPKTTAFTPAPPQTSEEVVREVQVLFNHILQANAVPTGAESVETDGLPSRQLFKDVRLTPRLLNSYLSVFYKHASLTQFRDLYRDIFERCNVPRTGRAFVEALERCANSRQGEERPLALQFSEEIWAQWQQMENSGLDNGRPLSARTIERAHIAMIRVLALTNKLGQAMQTVRSFASKYPASSVRTPTSKPHIRSTRTALEASRPLVRLTSSVEVPDDHVPPMLMFDDLQLLHHRLLAKGMKAEIGYITYLCKSYEWALRVRRDAAMKLRPMKTSETRITPVTALVG